MNHIVSTTASNSSSVNFSVGINREGQRSNATWSILNSKEKLQDSFIRLSSSGKLLSVYGRKVVIDDNNKSQVSPFEISLSTANDLRTEEVANEKSNHFLDDNIKDLINDPRVFVVEASKFDGHSGAVLSPDVSLKLVFVVGQYQPSGGEDQTVILCKGEVFTGSQSSVTEGARKVDNKVQPGSRGKQQILLDRIVLLTSNVEIKSSNTAEPTSCRLAAGSDLSYTRIDFDWVTRVVVNVATLVALVTLLLHPSKVYELMVQMGDRVGFPDPKLTTPFVTLSVSGAFHVMLVVCRVLLALVITLLVVMTPVRRDFLADFPDYFVSYTKCILELTDTISGGDGSGDPKQRLSFFVNGWNAWSFCGALLQGQTFPLYSMPHKFVKAFHDGSPSMDINLGKGKDSSRVVVNGVEVESNLNNPSRSSKRDYIASDMFTVIADPRTQQGVVFGFLSQKEQFGCVAINKAYDHIAVHVDCDGVPLTAPGARSYLKDDSKSRAPAANDPSSSQAALQTDWFCILPQSKLEDDPLGVYFELSGRYNCVRDMYSAASTIRVEDNTSKSAWQWVESLQSFGFGQSLASRSNDTDSGARSARVLGGSASTVPNRVPAGWCSWYHFFEKVSEADLTSNIVSMQSLKHELGMSDERLGFNLFQVDDGYQRAWGDWLQLDEKRFPSQSMNVIVEQTRSATMTPGLWMAPFACDKHSKLAADHPDWILNKNGVNLGRDKDTGDHANAAGVPANSANCGKWFYGLDVTNPEVRTHIHKCISTAVEQWGFRYLKLDFLYAAALGDAHGSYFDQSVTRARAMQIGLDTISEAMGKDVFLLGCGAPMGSVVGRVHANRVSADAGLSWLPPLPLPFYDKWNLPCARNMIRNSICRMGMHGRWWINDPDCMLLRTTTAFTEDEIISIATVKALSGGSFIISDDLATVPISRLRLAQQLLPATNKAAVPLDLLEKEMPELLRVSFDKNNSTPSASVSAWTLLATCNWTEREKFLPVSAAETNLTPVAAKDDVQPLSMLHIFEFWSGEYSYRVVDSNNNANSAKRASAVSGSRSLDSHRGDHITLREDLVLPPVPAHGAKLYALHVANTWSSSSIPIQYIGSNLHFSCGLEVKSVSCSAVSSHSHSCEIVFESGAVRAHNWNGFIWVFLAASEGVSVAEEAKKGVAVQGSAATGAAAATTAALEPVLVTMIDEPEAGVRGNVWKIPVGSNGNGSGTKCEGFAGLGELSISIRW